MSAPVIAFLGTGSMNGSILDGVLAGGADPSAVFRRRWWAAPSPMPARAAALDWPAPRLGTANSACRPRCRTR